MARAAVRVPGVPPFALHVHDRPDRYISEQLRRLGRWEPFETSVALALLQAGDTFVDLGANLGYYSVLASLRVGPTGRVFAFEPDPGNFALLESNLVENQIAHARVERCAVSEAAGEARLYLSADNLGDHRLFDSQDGRGTTPTPTVSLDGYFGDRARFPAGPGTLHLIKMDTQGCEALILRGAEMLVAGEDAPRAWIVEFWPFGLTQAGTDANELLARFAKMDLDLAILREDLRRAVPTTVEELIILAQHGLHPETGRFLNLVAIPHGDASRWARVMDSRWDTPKRLLSRRA